MEPMKEFAYTLMEQGIFVDMDQKNMVSRNGKYNPTFSVVELQIRLLKI